MGKKMVYMPSCHSTNEVASDLFKKQGIEEGTIVITDHQTNGKGQQGNYWEAERGKNITCSLVLKPKTLRIVDQFILNVITSLGLADTVSQILSIDAKVKWPNDVYCNDQKISGILINNTIKGSMLECAIVGIGLNVNQQHFSCDKATSLSLLSGNNTYDISRVLESLICSIEKRYFQWKSNEESLWNDYLSKMYWYGEERTYLEDSHTFIGVIEGVTKEGRLMIKDNGRIRTFDLKTIQFVK